MKTEITAEYEFEAAHYLPNVPVGHKCGRLHGHNYRVLVTVCGEVRKKEGWIMDFATLDALVEKWILQKLDHQKLNDISKLENPTAENIARWIFWRLYENGALLNAIRRVEVWETRRYSASFGGDA